MSLKEWLSADLRLPQGMHGRPEPEHAWWRVMCLTGVDYFSTLGYQPGIAFLAAGLLSPLATLILVLVTVLGALPVYWRVAAASPNGQGSIAMLETLFPEWGGKTVVLVLLGFAATDFVITMTLSAADAAAHFVENPLPPEWMKSQLGVTVILLGILGAIFFAGFREAIDIAVVAVTIYLTLNAVVTTVAVRQVLSRPDLWMHWRRALLTQHPHMWTMIGISLLLFPKLALGLSGFETGVAVMPLIRGENLAARIRNTRKLLVTAAMIMTVFLIASSTATTLLIDPSDLQSGGPANGRALAYLAHKYLGNGFGSLYDASTILILSFAGASALAGLLNLIPRYLPRFGMAPEWARAPRPLVAVFTAVGIAITFLFDANVDAQGGAYATGVLVLIASAAIAVMLDSWRRWLRWPLLVVSIVFLYTTVVNIHERPAGIKIAAFFIVTIVGTSLISRALRSTELRIVGVELDPFARALLAKDEDQVIHLIAHRPRWETEEALEEVDRRVRHRHGLGAGERVYFLSVLRGDVSQFQEALHVTGRSVGRHNILEAVSPVVPNAIAALLIYLEQCTGRTPHAYFKWTEGNPIGNLLRFLILGEGDIAPIAHEVLRRAISDPRRRPVIHVS